MLIKNVALEINGNKIFSSTKTGEKNNNIKNLFKGQKHKITQTQNEN